MRVKDDQFIPADLIVLSSSDEKGGLYVETKNLDGETNLKNKNVEKTINGMKLQGNWDKITKAKIVCEKPNNAIYKFEGYMEMPDGSRISLGAENMILRGCKLRNTEEIYGITIFTGHDSKIMMNSTKAKYKFSTLEIMNNKAVLCVLGV